MAAYKKVPIKQYPSTTGPASADTTYWQQLKSPIIVKEFAAVTSTNFSAIEPHDFIVAASTRVQIYSAITQTVRKTFSRFNDTVYCANIRKDGKLVVAGDASGLIQLFDSSSRAILRTLTGHNGAVRVADFSSNSLIHSGSDDNTMRIWDVTSETALHNFTLHTDYVRSVKNSLNSPALYLSGSYDHTVRLWDTRSNDCTLVMEHGDPVESVLYLPGGGLAVSSGSNKIKIWDLLAGGKLLSTFAPHQKTITCMALDGNEEYLLTGSLDHQVKFLSLQDYQIVHSIKYPAPILSIGISPNNSQLTTGMANGLLSVRKRVVKSEQLEIQAPTPRGGTKKFFSRTGDTSIETGAVIVESLRKKKLSRYDKLLKTGHYAEALDHVLSSPVNPRVVMSLIEDLIHRDGVRKAIGQRDEDTLLPLLNFIQKYISNPQYSSTLIDLSNIILDIYGTIMSSSHIMHEILSKLHEKVQMEIKVERQMTELLGMLETLSSQ